MRARRRLSWTCLAASAVLIALAAIARPQESTYVEAFLRAERAERTLGDLETAAGLYEKAAALAPADIAARANAEVRAGSCHRRLGDAIKARPLLAPWVEPVEGVPDALRDAAARELAAIGGVERDPDASATPAGTGPAEKERQLESLRRDNADLQQRLEGALERAEKFDEEELARLLGELKSRDQQIETLQAELERHSPRTAAEALELRRRENRERAAFLELLAQRDYRNGRFAGARAYASDALKLDPDNAGARALLSRISVPLRDRERLFEEILKAEALAREVRTRRVDREIETLVEEGRQRLTQDDHAGAVDPLERALALLGSSPRQTKGREERRVLVLGLLREAERAGATRRPLDPRSVEQDEPAWPAALRELLTEAGQEIVPGLELGFHDLDRVLAVASSGLPPVGPRPTGWSLAAARVPAADLVAAYLASTESQGLGAPGATIRVTGQTAVVLARREVQQRLDGRLAALAIHPGSSELLVISARRGTPGDWDAWLAARGLRSSPLPGGARSAVLPPEHQRSVNDLLLARPAAVFARAELTAAPFRAFELSAGSASSLLALRVLPIGGDAPGVGVHAGVTWTPEGRTDGASLMRETVAGARIERGGGLLLYGLPDPADPRRDVAVLIELRTRTLPGHVPVKPPKPGVGSEPPRPPPREPPTTPAGLKADQYPFPARIVGLHEVGPSALHVPDHPVPSRQAALGRRLDRLRDRATVLEVRDDQVVVVGPPETHAEVRAFLGRIEAASLASFEVELHQVDAGLERKIIEQVKTFAATPGGAFIWAVVRSADRRLALSALLARGGAQLPLAEHRVSAPATGRRDVALVLRSVYQRELEVRERPEPAWGRSETAWVDEGVLLALRPFGETAEGQVDLDLSLRAAFVNDRGASSRDTALGRVATLRPKLAGIWDDLSVQARPGETIVLAGLPNPFPATGGRDRLVVVVRPLD